MAQAKRRRRQVVCQEEASEKSADSAKKAALDEHADSAVDASDDRLIHGELGPRWRQPPTATRMATPARTTRPNRKEYMYVSWCSAS